MPDSSSSRLMIQKDAEKAVTIIEFMDRNILDEANIQQIGEEISRIIDASPYPKLLISFENVDHLSSAALGTLITISMMNATRPISSLKRRPPAIFGSIVYMAM